MFIFKSILSSEKAHAILATYNSTQYEYTGRYQCRSQRLFHEPESSIKSYLNSNSELSHPIRKKSPKQIMIRVMIAHKIR